MLKERALVHTVPVVPGCLSIQTHYLQRYRIVRMF